MLATESLKKANQEGSGYLGGMERKYLHDEICMPERSYMAGVDLFEEGEKGSGGLGDGGGLV